MDIPSKYMPLILYAMFSLFGGPQLDFALAILLGYLYSQGYCDRLKPSSYYLGELEAPGGNDGTTARQPLIEKAYQ